MVPGERENAMKLLATGLSQAKLITGEGIFQEPTLKKEGVWILDNHRDIQEMRREAQILRTRLLRFKSWLRHPLAV